MKKLALLLLALPLTACVSPPERSSHLAMAENNCANSPAPDQAYLRCVNVYLGSHYGWQEHAVQEPDGSLRVALPKYGPYTPGYF
jgi:hypothetical protein